ncbi:MAG: threonine--tRNA ligase [archaeon]
MKILSIHSDFLEFEPKTKALKSAEEAEKARKRVNECLVIFTSVEKGDDEGIVDAYVKEVESLSSQVKEKRIVLYPWVHLSQNPSEPGAALGIMKAAEKKLRDLGYEVTRAPFGWYKAFIISCKGHPLSELSRSLSSGGDTREEKRHELKKDFFVMDTEGKIYDVNDYKFKKGEEEFKILVEKEALRKEAPAKGEPDYIKAMKKFGFDWEPKSDAGHMRYGPLATFMFESVAEYCRSVVNDIGVPVYEVKGTQLFDVKDPAVAEHAKLFGDRLYSVKVGNKEFIMRYAACHQQFSMIKDWNISYKSIPFGAFEIADSYRLEQSGEIVFGFRTRRFFMPDMHVFCAGMEEAKKEFMRIHKRIYDEAAKAGRSYWDLYNLTEEFLKENKEWIHELVKYKNRPILISTVPQGEFYWTINIEYHIIDKDKKPREIATVQMDVGNAKRFGISFVSKENKKIHPIILHTAVIGGIERYIYMLFDTALQMKNPSLPLWITPTQVRLIPVSEDQLGYCEKLSEKFEGVRVDIDDTNDTLSKKIRNAETDWVPYIAVVGKKEVESSRLSVRVRNEGQKEYSVDELVSEIRRKTKGMPSKRLPLPKLLSKRPVFA